MTDDLQETEQTEMTAHTDKTETREQADQDWDDLKRELETLGEQVRSLRDHAGTLGETVLGNMELRFQDVLSRAHAYRNVTEKQMDDLRKIADEQASDTKATLKETSQKSAELAKEKARQLWDNSEPLRQGAQELGSGFLRAWSEIAASFGKAAETVQSERAKKQAKADGEQTTENQPS